MGEMRNEFKFVGEPAEGASRCRKEDNTKLNLTERGCEIVS
jgi:hypothetical protein